LWRGDSGETGDSKRKAERVPQVTKAHKRLGNHVRRLISLLAMAIIVGVATVPSASAVPQDPKAFVLAQDCTDGTGTILTLHPGVGKALWDVTTEVVSKAPSYLIKRVDQDVYVNDVFIGHFTFRFGEKVGLGDEFTCTYTETFTTPDGDVVKVLGTGVKVRL
jgi:hypothetical protein